MSDLEVMQSNQLAIMGALDALLEHLGAHSGVRVTLQKRIQAQLKPEPEVLDAKLILTPDILEHLGRLDYLISNAGTTASEVWMDGISRTWSKLLYQIERQGPLPSFRNL